MVEIMKFKFRVNNGVWFSPNIEFISEWEIFPYIKEIYGDEKIENLKIERIYPKILQEQAL